MRPRDRSFASSAKRRAEEPERPSFKGQLYESTQQRVQRERAELEKYAQLQKESPTVRYVATTLSKAYS